MLIFFNDKFPKNLTEIKLHYYCFYFLVLLRFHPFLNHQKYHFIENYNGRIKRLLGNKRLIQWPILLPFLMNEEEYYREILNIKDNEPRLIILKNKVDEFVNNFENNNKLKQENFYNIQLNNSQVDKINNIIKNNRDRFFNYNQNSCWLDSFYLLLKISYLLKVINIILRNEILVKILFLF